jgi:hypothetical protein
MVGYKEKSDKSGGWYLRFLAVKRIVKYQTVRLMHYTCTSRCFGQFDMYPLPDGLGTGAFLTNAKYEALRTKYEEEPFSPTRSTSYEALWMRSAKYEALRIFFLTNKSNKVRRSYCTKCFGYLSHKMPLQRTLCKVNS